MEVQNQPDELAAAVRNYLADHPELRSGDEAGYHHPLQGHCYAASEAYYHLSERELTPQQVNVGEVSHWFLSDGEVLIDLTAEQFSNRRVPYREATGRGFMPPSPSKRAKEVMEAIQNEQQHTAADARIEARSD